MDDDPSLWPIIIEFSPNIGARVYLHSDKAYVGLSIPNFIGQAAMMMTVRLLFFKKKINYYLIAGYILDLNSSVKV
jgi:hypothetical protein